MRHGPSRPLRVLGSLVMVGALALGLPACGGSEPPPCDDPVATSSVTMGEMFYEPPCIAAGTDATLDLVNEGSAPHTFTVKDTEVDADVPGGDQGQVTLTDVGPGTYQVICTYHPQMLATLVIGSKASG